MTLPTMQTYRVLLIDDNIDDRDFFKKTLESYVFNGYDYEIYAVESAEDAMRLCIEKQIDAYVIDYNMPGCDGAELLHMLQSQYGDKAMPALILTGDPSVEAQAATARVGALDYVIKSTVCGAEKLDMALQKVIHWSKAMNDTPTPELSVHSE